MKRVICTLLCLILALSLAACGQKTEPVATAAAPAAAPAATEAPASPAKLSGTVSTDGSTSMEKVIGALGEAFMEANSDVTFTYNPTGSGSGIQAVQEGRCDIGLSSRALKDEEKAAGLTVALGKIGVRTRECVADANQSAAAQIRDFAAIRNRHTLRCLVKHIHRCRPGSAAVGAFRNITGAVDRLKRLADDMAAQNLSVVRFRHKRKHGLTAAQMRHRVVVDDG